MQGTIKTLTDSWIWFYRARWRSEGPFLPLQGVNGVAFDDLKVGDVVTFEVTEGEKGPAATNVSRA